jgi:hypothetical protein
MPGPGIGRILLGPDEPEVLVVLDEVRALGNLAKEASVLVLQHLAEPRVGLEMALGLAHAVLVGGW